MFSNHINNFLNSSKVYLVQTKTSKAQKIYQILLENFNHFKQKQSRIILNTFIKKVDNKTELVNKRYSNTCFILNALLLTA